MRANYLGLPSLRISRDADCFDVATVRKKRFQIAFFHVLLQAPHKGCALICVEGPSRGARLCSALLLLRLHNSAPLDKLHQAHSGERVFLWKKGPLALIPSDKCLWRRTGLSNLCSRRFGRWLHGLARRIDGVHILCPK